MLLYANTYCDNDLSFSELYPINIKKTSLKRDTVENIWMNDRYYAVFILKGALRATNYYASFNIKGGQFFILAPYNHCRLYPTEDSEIIRLGFSGSRSGDFSPAANTVFDNPRPAEQLLSCIGRSDIHDVHLISFLFMLYGECGVYKFNRHSTKSTNPLLKMLTDNIDNSYFVTNYSIESTCRELGRNPKYISRLFKSETGISIQEYLKRRRLDAAYKLLSEGCKVHSAAFRCGIRDTSNFSEMFKKYYGMRPSEVLRKNAKSPKKA